jgi:hypothetical protein
VALVAQVALVEAQISFLEVASQSGIGTYKTPRRGFGAGIAAAGFDNDGHVDVFVPTAADSPHQLYRNLGNGQFEEVAASLGVAGTERGRAALWLDHDGDRRLDLLVSSDCYLSSCEVGTLALRLYRQTIAGNFEDGTAVAGLAEGVHPPEEHRSGLAAGQLSGVLRCRSGW